MGEPWKQSSDFMFRIDSKTMFDLCFVCLYVPLRPGGRADVESHVKDSHANKSHLYSLSCIPHRRSDGAPWVRVLISLDQDSTVRFLFFCVCDVPFRPEG